MQNRRRETKRKKKEKKKMRNKGEKKDLGKTKNKKILVEIATLNEEKCEKLKDR